MSPPINLKDLFDHAQFYHWAALVFVLNWLVLALLVYHVFFARNHRTPTIDIEASPSETAEDSFLDTESASASESEKLLDASTGRTSYDSCVCRTPYDAITTTPYTSYKLSFDDVYGNQPRFEAENTEIDELIPRPSKTFSRQRVYGGADGYGAV